MPLIIRLSPDDQLTWWRTDSDAEPTLGSLDELRVSLAKSAPVPIDVIVPGEHALAQVVSIPTRSRSKVIQAMPFAVEETLAQPLEQYHLALGRTVGDSRYWVIAVEQKRMERWVQALQSLPFPLRSMIPDTLLIESAADAHVWCEPGRNLLRTDQAAFAGTTAELEAMLALGAGGDRLAISEWTASSHWAGERLAHPESTALAGLAKHLVPDQMAVNLLQGAFDQGQESRQRSYGWLRYAAIIAGLAVGVELGHRSWQLLSAKQRHAEATNQSEVVLREAFPDVQRIVNPRLQMQQRLAAADSRVDTHLLAALRQAGPALANGQIDVRDLSFREGTLELRIQAASFDRIEAVAQQLSAAGLVPTVEQVLTVGGGTSAQLSISASVDS